MQQGLASLQKQPPAASRQTAPAPVVGKYNGPVSYHGITKQAVDGVVDYNGKKFFVSADGQLVWDEQRHVLGSLDAQGNLGPLSAIAQQILRKSGLPA
jgi:hypothetical protein